ncbi:tetraacyldisaccharide 4'-kinase [Xanthomarina sp. F1114]|uniref:tetraacyldisaccharide 4'-kinase n=1 Tax=Xanthomarina sp. F1114 TaxID=2996019 RepID=UPI00225E5596|nr:tetraacyldisaccharide 4'-kinase [Xanthomarina sp. F1114]MCX7547923.1 tetraacyldisaccharide 4'-kinase [Xanthomarina sp. F1114]
MKFLRYILFPIVPIYYLVTWTRNKLYDLGWKKSKSYAFPIICVGNLSVGGTGKSPMIEYLVRLLKSDYKLATLSRGYKRESEGFKLAGTTDSAKTLGDEPFQFYNKFGDEILVAVDANRQNGIENLHALNNKPDVILLDDAFQHRKVHAGFNILLTAYGDLYCNDIVLPTGNLREPKKGAKRAHIIVVTKCPINISDKEKEEIRVRLNTEAGQSVFFSSISYSNNIFSQTERLGLAQLKGFTLVTGIANPDPLIQYLKSNNLEFNHLNFKDHHNFSAKEILDLSRLDFILTTEKDFMRLKDEKSLKDKLFYLPIEVSLDKPEEFNKEILDYLKS